MAAQLKMPTKEKPARAKNDGQASAGKGRFYCALRQTPPRVLPPGVVTERAQLINMLSNKWVNGEHQNPKAGIVWNEEAVYDALAAPPNRWSCETTFWNIIRKLTAGEVQGTTWDPNSIMHYPFEKGLIAKPEEYATKGLQPKGGLSDKDVTWAKTLYPPLGPKPDDELKPAQSVLLNLAAGQQRNFTVLPKATRNYEFKTFGDSDAVMVLFEEDKGKLRYRTGDDDSGEGTNA